MAISRDKGSRLYMYMDRERDCDSAMYNLIEEAEVDISPSQARG